jgi:GAF domain-containing protein
LIIRLLKHALVFKHLLKREIPMIELPEDLALILAEGNSPPKVVTELLPAIGEVLQCDRCFLHLRNPQTRLHKNLCWRQNPDIPDTSTQTWEPEGEWEQEDPMFAAALRCAPSIFVEDIETAAPEVLNVEFERNNLGHRALIHAHICQDGALWGILQPSLFGRSRLWSERDRCLVGQVVERVRPFVVTYVREATQQNE